MLSQLLLLILPFNGVTAFLPALPRRNHLASCLQSATTLDPPSSSAEDDDEYEYIEYDRLTEAEFVGSEWLVGTCWDSNPNKIEETWVRLITDDSGTNVCVWGDDASGKWSLDVASQFLSLSKENVFGKRIWAATTEDYYYLSGTVRGWTYWQPASVLGQWQARRLGVEKDEAGTPPWFEESDETEQQPGAAEGESA